MCWFCLVMMAITIIWTLVQPERVAAINGLLTTQYLAFSGIVVSYFNFKSNENRAQLGGKNASHPNN